MKTEFTKQEIKDLRNAIKTRLQYIDSLLELSLAENQNKATDEYQRLLFLERELKFI